MTGNRPPDPAEKIAAQATRAVRERERQAEYEACKTDLKCWGEKHASRAFSACRDAIERHAKYQFEWTDGLFGSKFSRFSWKNKSDLTLIYVGDKIQFQNGFGAWQNMQYRCDYDPVNKKMLSVFVSEGRLKQ